MAWEKIFEDICEAFCAMDVETLRSSAHFSMDLSVGREATEAKSSSALYHKETVLLLPSTTDGGGGWVACRIKLYV